MAIEQSIHQTRTEKRKILIAFTLSIVNQNLLFKNTDSLKIKLTYDRFSFPYFYEPIDISIPIY